MITEDSYLTLKGRSESLYKVKGSKHFGYAFPAFSIDQVKEHLETIKNEHHSARHHCYAYRLGLDKNTYRANDDGEPSNSAGKPILGQIQSFDLTNVFIVVVRYFGGTKLGVGGLIDAYRTAAKMAIESNQIVSRQVHHFYKISFTYAGMPHIMNLLKSKKLDMSNTNFHLECSLETHIRMSEAESLEKAVKDISETKIELLNIA